MNSKAILGISIGSIALLAILVVIGKPSNSATSSPNPVASPNSTLKADEINFDFGEISMTKGNVSHVFTVANTGGEPVVVSKLYTSCMCTTASIMNGTEKVGPFGMPGHSGIPSIKVSLAPGASTQVEAIFDPAAHGPAGVGTISRVVILENSAGVPFKIGFTAKVIP